MDQIFSPNTGPERCLEVCAATVGSGRVAEAHGREAAQLPQSVLWGLLSSSDLGVGCAWGN